MTPKNELLIRTNTVFYPCYMFWRDLHHWIEWYLGSSASQPDAPWTGPFCSMLYYWIRGALFL